MNRDENREQTEKIELLSLPLASQSQDVTPDASRDKRKKRNHGNLRLSEASRTIC
jgi:hypothetical protein